MADTQTSSRAEYLPMIRDLPAAERPRERLLHHGAGALSNAELLAILLRTGVAGESALNVAQRLLARFAGLRGIATASYGELAGEKGVSQAKYCQVMAALELGRRLASVSVDERLVIHSPQDVANLLMAEMALLSQEHLRVLLLTSRNQVLGVHTIYVGTVNTSPVRAAEVFRPAVRENCPAVILVHNHPSGDPTPSGQDVELTRQLIRAGQLLNVEVVDHVILGRHGVASMKEKGLAFDSPDAPREQAP